MIYAIVTLLIHAFMTWMMVGMIFFVQIVYLPLFRKFRDHLTAYEKKDLIHMGYLAGPIYFFEIVTGCMLPFMLRASKVYHILAIVNLCLLILIWAASFIIRSRYKKKYTLIFIHKMHRILLSSNWFRTIVWGLRGILVMLMLLYSSVMLW